MSSSELIFTATELDGSERWQTERPGFRVEAALPNLPKVPLGYAEAFEGYYAGWDNEVERAPEAGVLHVQYVRSLGVTQKAPKGIGTALMREVLREGRERGYQVGRADAAHCRMISVLGKLAEEGCLENLELYGGLPLLLTSDRLRLSGRPVDLAEAKSILEAGARPEYQHGQSPDKMIRTIFSIPPQ